jgi:antitoxin component HigA of HigAB toxin-antitoxin module
MTLIQDLLKQSEHGKRELARQDLIVDTTEQIWEALEVLGMTKADLARSLGTSKANVTQFLSGHRNLTLNTIADIGEAVGMTPRVVFHQKSPHQDGASSGAYTQWFLGKTKAVVMQSFGHSPVKGNDERKRVSEGFGGSWLTSNPTLVAEIG